MRSLAAAEQQFFAAQGYLIVRQMATSMQLQKLRDVAERQLCEARQPLEYEADVAYPGAPAGRDEDGGATIRRLLHAYQRHADFADWGRQSALIRPIAQLLDTHDLRLVLNHHNCVMTKHPRFSSTTMWHQDFRYWRFEQNALVTAWLALTRETARKGCMRLIPGSHAVSLDQSRFDEASFFRTDLPENRALMHQALRAELEPGDVLLFHSGLLHAAGRNQTEERKLALVYTYRSASNSPLPGTRSSVISDIALSAVQ